MIEFVNHIELLVRIMEKVWRISTARRLTAHCLTRRNVSTPFKCLLRYLIPPPPRNQREDPFPQKKTFMAAIFKNTPQP